MSRRRVRSSGSKHPAIALWSLGKVKPYPDNPRLHSDGEIARLAAFIERVGFLSPIIVDEHGVILAGHRRRAAAAVLNLANVPVLQHCGLSEADKRAYRVAEPKAVVAGG